MQFKKHHSSRFDNGVIKTRAASLITEVVTLSTPLKFLHLVNNSTPNLATLETSSATQIKKNCILKWCRKMSVQYFSMDNEFVYNSSTFRLCRFELVESKPAPCRCHRSPHDVDIRWLKACPSYPWSRPAAGTGDAYLGGPAHIMHAVMSKRACARS